MPNFFDQFDSTERINPSDPPSPLRIEVTPRNRDLAIRTVLGEAANEPEDGQAAVAAVIRNRAQSQGGDLARVILAKNQFEPWNTQQGRSRMFAYAPDSEPYKRAAAAVDRVFGEGYDPTQGATHFFSPTAQAALGRQPPSWAQGEPLTIGRHAFYAPEGRVQVAQAGQSAPAQSPAQSGNFFDQFDAPQSTAPPETFVGRFTGDPNPQQPNPKLKEALSGVARAATMGEPTSMGTAGVIDFLNQLPAAAQGTTPMVEAHAPNIVSDQVFESDSGEILYRDPADGQVKPTDQKTQVAIRDPADNRVKIYARTADTNEGRTVGLGRFASMGLMTGPAPRAAAMAPSAAQNVAGAAERLGVELPRGVVSDNRGIQALTQAARQVPITGAKIDDRILGAVETMGSKVGQLAESTAGGVLDRAATGAVARASLKDMVAANNSKIDEAYTSLRSLINPDLPVGLPATGQVLERIKAARASAGNTNVTAGIENIANLVESGASFNGIQRARTELSDAINFGKANPGFNQGDLKQLRAALSADMAGVVRASALPGRADQAAAALTNANSEAAKLIETNKTFSKLANITKDESIVGTILNAASGKTGDVATLAKIRSAMPADDFNQIVGLAVSELGKNAATGQFSAAQFVTQWNKIGDRAKGVMFAEPSLRRSLGDIATVADRLKKVEQYANRSNTGRVVLLGGALGLGAGSGFDVNPLKHLEKVIPAATVAFMLGRPATASSVARWSRAYEKLATSPTAASLASFNMASRNLSTMARDAGATVSPNDFLRAIQGPGVARPEEQQP